MLPCRSSVRWGNWGEEGGDPLIKTSNVTSQLGGDSLRHGLGITSEFVASVEVRPNWRKQTSSRQSRAASRLQSCAACFCWSG